ncbi:MAG: Choline-sulfatase [Candidatus Lokiarchaeum sp. GC14_75]|nr:MAG: Choline-sulfatase [Candidatus Lokiarchaeum sp. GC14_75]
MRILYLDIDTLRPDHLGCYGYHRNTSPHIDKIAENGTKFTNCYVSDAPCLPSRAALFTGRFGIHSGIVGHGGTTADLKLTGKIRGFQDQYLRYNWISMLRRVKLYPVSISSFAERHSAFWFYSGWKEMHNPGFRGNERADQLFPFVEKWLKDNEKKDNWFLHVNFWDPHTPYRTPMEFGNPFENQPAPSWITQEVIDKQRKSYGPHSACEPMGLTFQESPQELPRLKRLKEIRGLNDFKLWIDGYDAGIRYTDDYIGKVVKILKDFGIFEDTLIIISSDHGENQGELNIYGDHATACHITNRVPLIIKWPHKNWKNEYNSLIYQSDMAATVIDGFGLTAPEFWDGKSFLNNLDNNIQFGRDFLVISQNAWSCQRAVRFNNWTLINTYHTGLKDFPKTMLFDYENDYHMLKNIADERPKIVEKGVELLETWQKNMMQDNSSNIDPMETVLKEGGPFHTRGTLKYYLNQLKKSGREDMVKVILDRKESYNF